MAHGGERYKGPPASAFGLGMFSSPSLLYHLSETKYFKQIRSKQLSKFNLPLIDHFLVTRQSSNHSTQILYNLFTLNVTHHDDLDQICLQRRVFDEIGTQYVVNREVDHNGQGQADYFVDLPVRGHSLAGRETSRTPRVEHANRRTGFLARSEVNTLLLRAVD